MEIVSSVVSIQVQPKIRSKLFLLLLLSMHYQLLDLILFLVIAQIQSAQSNGYFQRHDVLLSSSITGLRGTNGFVLHGSKSDEQSGFSVSGAGDFDNDGYHDILVSAIGPSTRTAESAGKIYLVFGEATSNFSATQAEDLIDKNAHEIRGYDKHGVTGFSVSSAGDINHDGYDDILIGDPEASGHSGAYSGQCYVVFGRPKEALDDPIDLRALDGKNGFVIHGIDQDDALGYSLSSAGDVNGDYIDDILVGAPYGYGYSGQIYVIFGAGGDFDADFYVGDLNGTNGFVLNGGRMFDGAGWSVSGAGDINGDGHSDIVIGSPYSSANGSNNCGKSYIVFGSGTNGFAATIKLDQLSSNQGHTLQRLEQGTKLRKVC